MYLYGWGSVMQNYSGRCMVFESGDYNNNNFCDPRGALSAVYFPQIPYGRGHPGHRTLPFLLHIVIQAFIVPDPA
jgi:hypothetical protein